MKLDWKRAGCASIAECGELTCVVCTDGGDFMARVEKARVALEAMPGFSGAGAAEAWCEGVCQQHDRPEWHEATPRLSWAEWGGWQFVARTAGWKPFMCQVDHPTHGFKVFHHNTIEAAKAAAEKWVREQGA